MKTTAEPVSAEDSEENRHKHISGAEHAARSFHYECALRCLWLLELRGTKNRLSIAEGEDTRILQADGRIIYRQARKREGTPLVYDNSFRAFVERAYQRFIHDNSVRHEFYTNQAIPSGGSKLRNGKRLNAANNKVREIASLYTGLFCNSVYLFPERYHTEPSVMSLMVKEQLRCLIDSAFPGCKALNFVNDQDIDEFAAKLLAFESEFWSKKTDVAWRDVDARLGLDRLIKDLYSRSMAGGALAPFDKWPTADEGGPDDERIKAIEAVRDGSAISRARIENMVWPVIDDWWARTWKGDAKAKPYDYLLVVLAGEHGTGKTWSLMSIGSQMSERYNGICMCVAAASPPDHPFAFDNLAISQPGPCAILIDGLFPDWSRLVSCITGPYAHPLLFIGTAAWPDDEEDLRGLMQRLGRRAKAVVLPGHLDDTEAEDLTCSCGVSVRVAALSRAKAANIRHLAQILSGISAPDLMIAMLGLLSSIETLDLIGPILLCTSLGVKVPKELLERSIGRPLPPELQPGFLAIEGRTGSFCLSSILMRRLSCWRRPSARN